MHVVHHLSWATLCWNSGWWQKPARSFYSIVKAPSSAQERGETGRAAPEMGLLFTEGVFGINWAGLDGVDCRQLTNGPLELVTDSSGLFLHSKQSFMRSQIRFPFPIKQDCVQHLVMKKDCSGLTMGSGETDPCVMPIIFPEQERKEVKKRTFLTRSSLSSF